MMKELLKASLWLIMSLLGGIVAFASPWVVSWMWSWFYQLLIGLAVIAGASLYVASLEFHFPKGTWRRMAHECFFLFSLVFGGWIGANFLWYHEMTTQLGAWPLWVAGGLLVVYGLVIFGANIAELRFIPKNSEQYAKMANIRRTLSRVAPIRAAEKDSVN